MGFYLLPFTTTNLAKGLHVKQTKISEANTTSMLSRTIGAIIFGVASDQYGRKIPLLIDIVLMAVMTMCSGFIHTYGELVGVRFLFGKFFILNFHRLAWKINLKCLHYGPRSMKSFRCYVKSTS